MAQHFDTTRGRLQTGRSARAGQALGDEEIFLAMARMSSLLAHEMLNPLAAALGQAELLEATLADGPVRDKIIIITQELDRLRELSQNLLDFVHSRRVQRDEYSCAQLVMDLAQAVRDERVTIDQSRIPPVCWCDNKLLLRALTNIVQNALSVSDTASRVEVTFSADGDALSVVVRDHGPGFEDSIDAFEPFTTTKFQGTGLGLAIAAEIIHAHGGQIEAFNHHDGGAVVCVGLPLSEPHELLIEI